MVEENVAEVSTRLLRTGDDPLWSRLRELFRERGHDPAVVALADLFPDDSNLEFGVLVTAEGQVWEFELVYGSGDINHQTATSFVRTWRDATEYWRDRPNRTQVEAAMRLLAQDTSSREGKQIRRDVERG